MRNHIILAISIHFGRTTEFEASGNQCVYVRVCVYGWVRMGTLVWLR